MLGKNKFDLAALLFTLHFWNIIYLKPLIYLNEDQSTLILFVSSFLIFLFYFLGIVLKKIESLNIMTILIIFIVIVIFLFSYLFNYNYYLNNYLYDFISRVLLFIILFGSIRDFKYLLKLMTNFSFIAITLYGFSPLLLEGMFTNYMDYGFTLSLPAFILIYISWVYYKKSLIKFLYLILTFILLVIFSNRSSLLSVLFLIITHFIFFNKNKLNLKFISKIILLLFIFGFSLYFLDNLILIFYNISKTFNYESYSINRFYYELIIRNTDLFYSRNIILRSATPLITSNIIFGSGIGTFESLYKLYSHNLIVDFLLHGGLTMALFFMLLIFYSIFKWTNINDKNLKYIGLVFLSSWFPKLFLSSSYLIEPNFWLFILLSLSYTSNKKIYIFRKLERSFQK